ncbi:MAG TPA: CopD family protein [Stellaceae bacterium]|nr:CopD family protein [Stellaceae bacterium]
MTILALALHILSAVLWVGGMLFAHQVLRPSASPLEAAVRLPLWARVFARFLPMVMLAVVLLLVTGYAMVFLVFGGFGGLPLYVDLMQAIGIIMMMIFLHLFFAPWKRFRRAVAAGDLAAAGRDIEQIRMLVGVNLVLGLAVVVIAATGRYW